MNKLIGFIGSNNKAVILHEQNMAFCNKKQLKATQGSSYSFQVRRRYVALIVLSQNCVELNYF